MLLVPRCRPGRAGLLVLLGLGIGPVGGCAPADPLARAGLDVRPGAGWRRVAASTWVVPGRPLAAWSGPGGSSLVAYGSPPTPGLDAASVGRGVVQRLENLPGVRVVGSEGLMVDGRAAARVELTAPGTGDALAPSGTGVAVAPAGKTLRPTRRVLVVVPRPADTLSLVWHAPDDRPGALAAEVGATLKALKVGGGRLRAQSY